MSLTVLKHPVKNVAVTSMSCAPFAVKPVTFIVCDPLAPIVVLIVALPPCEVVTVIVPDGDVVQVTVTATLYVLVAGSQIEGTALTIVSEGSITVVEVVLEHPFASVTVTV